MMFADLNQRQTPTGHQAKLVLDRQQQLPLKCVLRFVLCKRF